MARPVSFVKFVSFVDADRAAFIHRSVTWRVVGTRTKLACHSSRSRPVQTVRPHSGGGCTTQHAPPRREPERRAKKPGRRSQALCSPSPYRQLRRIRAPCGDGRLRRESARTAPIAERCHLGPAQRTAEQTCRKLSHLPDLTPIPLSRSSRARCRRPIPAPAGVVGRRAGGARIHDLRPHCLPPAQSYVEQWIGHLWSSFLLVIYWRKKNVPELSDFPQDQSRTVFGGRGPGERPHMVT